MSPFEITRGQLMLISMITDQLLTFIIAMRQGPELTPEQVEVRTKAEELRTALLMEKV